MKNYINKSIVHFLVILMIFSLIPFNAVKAAEVSGTVSTSNAADKALDFLYKQNEKYLDSQADINIINEKEALRLRLITILNKYKGYNLNDSNTFDQVVSAFLAWYTEYHPGQYLEGTYDALPNEYKLKVVEHWADMIEAEYDQGTFAANLLPQDFIENIPAVPMYDSSLGKITNENKYDSQEAFDYYVKYYYPRDAFNEMNYKNYINYPDQQKLLLITHFKPWARNVYGSSQSEQGEEFSAGRLTGLTICPLKVAYDCIDGMYVFVKDRGWDKTPELVNFIAKSFVSKEYQEALVMMIEQAYVCIQLNII